MTNKLFLLSVEIIRLEEDFTYGTFGKLRVNKILFCETLEPRDEENAQNISSIPAQQYICERVKTQLSGILRLGLDETFEVMNVPGRTLIRFHPGNSVKDTEGCPLLGQYLGKLKGDRAILNSGNTFKSFMDMMDGINKFHLTIREVY